MSRGGWIVVEEGEHVELKRVVLLPGHGDHDDDHHDVDHDHDDDDDVNNQDDMIRC